YAISRGFWLTRSLVESLERYEKNRELYPTLSMFMPRLVADLNRTALNFDTVLGQIPKVVDIQPKNGTKDLPPEVPFRIKFDRPMDRTSRGIAIESDGKYNVVVPGKFDDSARVYSVTIRFQSSAFVKAWINRSGMGMTSESGYAAALQMIEFQIASP